MTLLWPGWLLLAIPLGLSLWVWRLPGRLLTGLRIATLALVLLAPLTRRLSWVAIFLIALGGVLYTGGVAVMITGRPRLWPRFFSSHEVFHVLVVAASSVHFAAVAGWVANYAPA